MIDAYRARGWVPVPVRPGEKRPAEPAWQTRTLDSPWPAGEWDIGLVLGTASGGLVDVDLDCPEAVELAPAMLPRTAGFGHRPERGHLLYVCPEITKRETYDFNGMVVEIRADNNQTVVPPSGGRRWVEPWVEPLVIDAAELRRRVGALAALVLVARSWPKGGRHEAQLALAGTLLAEGWTEDETLEALCAVTRIAGDEDRPKREATVRRTAERVAACEEVTGWGTLAAALPPEVAKVARGWLGSKRVETVGIDSLKNLAKVLSGSRDVRKKDLGKLLHHVACGDRVAEDVTELARVVGREYPDADLEALANTFARSTDRNVRGALEKGQREAQERAHAAFERKDHAELTRRVLAVLGRSGELCSDQGLWRYEDGIWRAVDDGDITRAVFAFSGAPLRKGGEVEIYMSDVDAVRRAMLGTISRVGWFDAVPPGVAFKGLFVGLDGEVPLGPEHRQRTRYEWAWDATATCPAWEGFLRETIEHDAIPTLQEFVGACLFNVATTYQRFLVLYGTGGTGKSQVIDVVKGIMPEGATSAVAPHDWRREYSRAALVGVRLNSVSEMPSAELFDAESVKAIVTGDSVQAREPYKKPFVFRPTAGHVFAANALPPVRDSSTGFWRRAVVIGCDRVVQSPVIGLGQAILEEERAGIVAWAVRGARRLLSTGHYSPVESSLEVVAEWRQDSDSVLGWLAAHPLSAEWTDAQLLYDSYRLWAMGAGLQPCSLPVYGRRLGAYAAKRRTHKGIQYRKK